MDELSPIVRQSPIDELLSILSTRPISSATITSHINTFKKISPLLLGRNITSLTYFEILQILESPLVTSLSLSYKRKIISLLIVVFDSLPDKSPVTKLRQIQKALSDDITTDRVTNFTTKDTDQYQAIFNYIHSPEVISDPRKFVVNYIVFFLNTRNLDLLAKPIVHRDEMTDDKLNYLLIHDGYIEYVRNTYKTAKRYNQKITLIRDPLFYMAVRRLPLNTYILTDNTNSLGRMVQNMLYNGMSETEYLHNNIAHFKNDVNQLFRIQNNRGTNIETLLSSYNKEYNPSVING